MVELPLVFIAGLLGSSHCIGMCGGFALTIGGTAPSVMANLKRQSFYTAGRLFTYGTLGALAGFGGWQLAQEVPNVVNVPATFAIVAGAFLVYQGAVAAGWLPVRWTTGRSNPCLAGTFFATFLRSNKSVHLFLAGLFTGFLPCGLLYGMLALAASFKDVGLGLFIMFVFGLGTAPIMILTGCGGSALTLAARRHAFRIAAWCVIVTGIISIARGVGFLALPGLFDTVGCPICPS
jgi:sulfite exporter TauE/SafE